MLRRSFLAVLGATALGGCASTGLPDGIEPVRGFEAERYLGTWYEIARLDHRFERGLEAVTAAYARRDDGSISVLNRGWSSADEGWSEAQGRARFAGPRDVAHLEVSFFGPFYASYVVFELDPDYRHAYVTGADRSTLWFLSRTPQVDPAELARFRERAERQGFDLDELILVDQSRNIDS